MSPYNKLGSNSSDMDNNSMSSSSDDEKVGHKAIKSVKVDNADQHANLDDSVKSRFISLALCISALLLQFGGLILWSLTNFAIFYCYTGAGAQFVGETKTAGAKVLVGAL